MGRRGVSGNNERIFVGGNGEDTGQKIKGK
jgi:hypothetical protein